jgi:hypothetical protein
MREPPEILRDFMRAIDEVAARSAELVEAQKLAAFYPELAAQMCAAGAAMERHGRAMWTLGDLLGRLDGAAPSEVAP